MSEIIEGALEEIPYFSLQRRYPDGASAEHVFLRLMAMSKSEKGKLDLGCYRVVPNGVGEATVIVLVSLQRKGVEFAAKVMGGEPTDVIEAEVLDALMRRRVRVVAPILKGKPSEGGQVLIRRPAGRGAHLHSDGTLDEKVGRG